jgi:hypothetical protein
MNLKHNILAYKGKANKTGIPKFGYGTSFNKAITNKQTKKTTKTKQTRNRKRRSPGSW